MFFALSQGKISLSTEPHDVLQQIGTVNLRGMCKMTIEGVHNSDTYKSPYMYSTECIPLLKSNLQKCVRRQDVQRSIRTAFAMYSISPDELLRRLPMIMIEDTLVCIPAFCKIVWWMCAVSKGYVLSKAEVDELMYIVYSMCQTTVYDQFTDQDVPSSSYNGVFQICSDIRKAYGGMKIDMSMIDYHKAVTNPAHKLWDKMNDYTPQYVDTSKIQKLALVDVLSASVDQHPFPWLLNRFYTGAGYDIWCCRSRCNNRTDIKCNSIIYAPEECTQRFQTIAIELEGLSRWLIQKTIK